MARSQITAALLPASTVLDPATAPTIAYQQSFLDDLATALNGAWFKHAPAATSKQNGFQETVNREIGYLLTDSNTVYEWWVEINKSQPQGNIWNTSTTH